MFLRKEASFKEEEIQVTLSKTDQKPFKKCLLGQSTNYARDSFPCSHFCKEWLKMAIRIKWCKVKGWIITRIHPQKGKGSRPMYKDIQGFLDWLTKKCCQARNHHKDHQDRRHNNTTKDTLKIFRNHEWIREKGEVNWTEMNELERAIENLEDNTAYSSPTALKPKSLEIWIEQIKWRWSPPS